MSAEGAGKDWDQIWAEATNWEANQQAAETGAEYPSPSSDTPEVELSPEDLENAEAVVQPDPEEQ